MFKINVKIMNAKIASAIAIALVVVTAGMAAYLQSGVGSSKSVYPSVSDLKSGAHITITKNDKKMLGGGAILSFKDNGYYAVEYHLDLKSSSILTGSWSSTGESLVWVLIDGAVYMAIPLPDATNGTLNQTLIPGQYTLVIGGYPGDVISITNPIEIQSYVPKQISNFSIPAGTHISSGATYSFYLSKPGELVGSFTTPAGVYSFSLYNSKGIGFETSCSNSSAQPTPNSFNLSPHSQIFGPGYYTLSFSGEFYVSQTLEFLYYYDNSTF